ncbi:MAG: DUF4917 family protein [Alphaproteobacteria bacterium]|nr:DUF4917 family protein [Alphaproteobacteria bacterium]
MVEVISFQQALDRSGKAKRNLLLGNGFSIACEPRVFSYSSLYEQAQSSAFRTTPELQNVFQALETNDFEVAIRALEDSAKLIPIYAPAAPNLDQTILQHARTVKDALIRTIAENHPATPSEVSDQKFYACRNFLSNFIGSSSKGRVYTLNYDLLLYWAVMHDESLDGSEPIELTRDDGFRADQDNDSADYVIWNGEGDSFKQNIHYLHGAVHLFDAGSDLKKYTWVNTGIPLLTQARSAMDQSMFPLFVAEGTSQNKLAKIKHSAYLHHSFKSFYRVLQETNQSLFVYGHSLADNDQHVLDKIGKGRVRNLFISLYGSPQSSSNQQIIAKAQSLALMRNDRYPLDIQFYDAQSAQVWG